MGWFDRMLGRREPAAAPLVKAQRALPQPQAHNINPFDFYLDADIASEIGAADSDTMRGIGFDVLRQMARTPVIAAILNTRGNQVAEFAQPQPDRYSLGYKIQLRDRNKVPSATAMREMERISRWLGTCGDPRISDGELNLESFLRQITRDSLIFDQACFEVIKTRSGLIAGFVPVDASTIRRAALTDRERDTGRRALDGTRYVQVIEQKIAATWQSGELGLGIRRPRTWIAANGYGHPELEELVRTVTALLSADMHKVNDYNAGLSTAGILAVKSKMNPQLFRAFRREFYAMLSGAANSRRTPVIQLDPENNEDLQSINLDQNRDWQDFQAWTSYLLKIACAIYQIDAAELGFIFGAEGQVAAMNHQGPADKITLSKEKGLRPLLRSLGRWLNHWVIHPLDGDFELAFGGLSARTEADAVDLDGKKCRAFMTINEIRAVRDLPPLDSAAADMVLDPTYMNTALQMEQMAGEEAPEGAPEGAPDAADDEGGEDDFDIDAFFAANAGANADAESTEPEPIAKSITVEVI